MLNNPNPLMTTSEFLEKVTWLLFLNYNAFIIPVYYVWKDERGVEKRQYEALYPIQPSQVDFIEDASGQLFVKFRFNNGQEYTVRYSDVIHIEDYMAKLDELGGGNTMKRGVEGALKASKQHVNPLIGQAMSKLPAGGKYSTGDTKKSIDTDMSVDWEGMTGSIKVGFDFSKSGLKSIFLMYGTPRMKPVSGLKNAIYGTKTQKELATMNNIYVLDQNLQLQGVIDEYVSIIWRPAYYDIGDFEIYLGATDKAIDLLRENRYVVRSSDISVENGVTTYKKVMIIKNLQLITDVENGDFLTVTGRELKYILHQRIVWGRSIIRDSVEYCLRRLIGSNAVHPVEPARVIGLQDFINENTETMLVNALPVSVTVALSPDGWTLENGLYKQSVTVLSMNATKSVMVQPASESATAYASSEVKCVSQSDNTLTFTAITAPTATLNVDIVHMGV